MRKCNVKPGWHLLLKTTFWTVLWTATSTCRAAIGRRAQIRHCDVMKINTDVAKIVTTQAPGYTNINVYTVVTCGTRENSVYSHLYNNKVYQYIYILSSYISCLSFRRLMRRRWLEQGWETTNTKGKTFNKHVPFRPIFYLYATRKLLGLKTSGS